MVGGPYADDTIVNQKNRDVIYELKDHQIIYAFRVDNFFRDASGMKCHPSNGSYTNQNKPT